MKERAEILAAVDKAEAALSRGEGRAITEQSMRELANEVKQRGRLRFARPIGPTKDGSWMCSACAKVRNTLRSVQRHIARKHRHA